MIEYAEKADFNEIKNVYNACFPNEEKFCDWFYDNFFNSINVIVYRYKGKIAGMAAELVYSVAGLGEVTYLYSVATLPQYRGQGICRDILEKSHSEDMARGRAASVLIPASKELFDFYGRLGYKSAFYINKKEIFAAQCNGRLEECSPKEMDLLYEKELKDILHIKRGEKYFKCMTDMYRKFGGGCLGLYFGSELAGYCFYSSENGKVTFDEVMGRQEAAGQALNRLGIEKAMAKMPFGGDEFGMAYFYGADKSPMYMNLMFN